MIKTKTMLVVLMVGIVVTGCALFREPELPPPPLLEMEIGYLEPEASGNKVTFGVVTKGGAKPIGCRCEVGDGTGAEIVLKEVVREIETIRTGWTRWEGAYAYSSWGEYTATCTARDMSGQTVTDDVLFITYDNGVVCWYTGGIPGFPQLKWNCTFEGWGMVLPEVG